MKYTTSVFTIAISLLVFEIAVAQRYEFSYENSDKLPEVQIDGKSVVIHTQGLFVTENHYLVTGRLEEKPKRALLLRFSRKDLAKFEYLDITPPVTDGETLDHPGGFDIDAKGCYAIPISTSHRRGPTLIKRLRIDPEKSLKQVRVETTTKIDDHIGAICSLGDTLVGANWDTKIIHYISLGGIETSVAQEKMLNYGKPHVAVQDWKSLVRDNSGEVVLGGIDKSEKPNEESVAIVQFYNIRYGGDPETYRLPNRADVKKPLTNEGLAVFKEKLYLLPEDIGRGAKVLRFSMKRIKQNPAD